MTYGEFKNLVLQHLDQYSVAGTVIPNSYNNQADTVNRIPNLTNIVLRTMATQTAPIMATLHPLDKNFTGLQDLGVGWSKITMPTDFWKMTGNGISNFSGENGCSGNSNYRYLTDRELLVRTSDLPGMLLTYYRYPRRVQGQEKEILDCSDAAADCASFYVAAQLARTEDAYAYQSLYNEYETMLARLSKPQSAEFIPAQDAYGTWDPY